MALSSSGGCPCQSMTSPVTLSGSRERYDRVRIAWISLVGQVGVILDRPGRLHDVDSAGTITECQLRTPDGGIQGAGEVDVGRRPIQIAKVCGTARLDEVSRSQASLRAMEEPSHASAVARGAGPLVDVSLPMANGAWVRHDERAVISGTCAVLPVVS
jgi:hypothetical protein